MPNKYCLRTGAIPIYQTPYKTRVAEERNKTMKLGHPSRSVPAEYVTGVTLVGPLGSTLAPT